MEGAPRGRQCRWNWSWNKNLLKLQTIRFNTLGSFRGAWALQWRHDYSPFSCVGTARVLPLWPCCLTARVSVAIQIRMNCAYVVLNPWSGFDRSLILIRYLLNLIAIDRIWIDLTLKALLTIQKGSNHYSGQSPEFEFRAPVININIISTRFMPLVFLVMLSWFGYAKHH